MSIDYFKKNHKIFFMYIIVFVIYNNITAIESNKSINEGFCGKEIDFNMKIEFNNKDNEFNNNNNIKEEIKIEDKKEKNKQIDKNTSTNKMKYGNNKIQNKVGKNTKKKKKNGKGLSKYEIKKCDWLCPICANHNFSSRIKCNMCLALKPVYIPYLYKK